MEAAAEKSSTVELATFYIGEALCGMDILNVQEINKLMDMTKVPQAPTYVTGILNLRGQIVTVIDLGKKLGLTSTEFNDSTRNIIVNSENEYIGLLVSSISDDGTAGLKLMKSNGAVVIAQNELSCVVFGMPKEPIQQGIADVVAPLGTISQAILKTLSCNGTER